MELVGMMKMENKPVYYAHSGNNSDNYQSCSLKFGLVSDLLTQLRGGKK